MAPNKPKRLGPRLCDEPGCGPEIGGGWPCAVTCEAIRYRKSTGTKVNDNSRLAESEIITDSDNGEKRYFAVPVSRNTGTNTTLMDSVESRVGTPTSEVPLRIAGTSGSPNRT